MATKYSVRSEDGSRSSDEDDGSETQVEQLKTDMARINEQRKRALADLDNYRKRFDREVARLRDEDRDALFRGLLPVVDNLERALASPADSHDQWRAGVEAVHRQLIALLKRYGVEATADRGQTFDPTWHEVLATTTSDEADGTIIDVAERGYRYGDRPLRPARVVVAKSGGG